MFQSFSPVNMSVQCMRNYICICNMELPLTETILSQTPQNEDEVTFHVSCASGQKNCGSVFLDQLLFPCFHIEAEIES